MGAINMSNEKKAVKRVKGVMILLILLAAMLGFVNISSVAFADTLLDFNNLELGHMPNNYAGFIWSPTGDNSWYTDWVWQHSQEWGINAKSDPAEGPVMISRNTLFDFKSAWFTPRSFDLFTIQVQGYRGSNLLYDRTIMCEHGGFNVYVFNWTGIDKLTFTPSGGTILLDGSERGFLMDNFTYADSSVPIPAAVWLLGSGLLGLLGIRRKLNG